MSRLRPNRRDLVCFGILLLALALFLVPRFLTVGTVYFSTPHEHSGVAIHATFQVANAALWGEGVPLWNPWSGCGTPHLANLQSSVFFPLHVLFLVLAPVPAAEVALILRLLLAGVAAFGLGRSLGLTRGAALFLACAYALNAWELRFANNAYGNGVMLLPLTLLAYLELGRTGGTRPFVAAVVLTALHVLAGLPESAAFSLGFATLVYLFAAFAARGRSGWGTAPRRLVSIALVLAGGALLAAAQVLPFLEYLDEAWSTHLGYVDFSARRTPVVTVPGLAYPFTDPLLSIRSTSLSAGAVVLCFAVRGLVRPLCGGLNFMLAAYALLASLKVFGVQPVHALGLVPVFDVLDYPLYLPPSVHLSLAVVAALGLDEWRRSCGARAPLRPWLVAAVLAAVLWMAAPKPSVWNTYALALAAVTTATLTVAVAGRRAPEQRTAPLVALVIALLGAELWLHYSRIPNETGFFERIYEQPLRTGGGDVGHILDGWMGDERRFRLAGARIPGAELIWGPSAGFDYSDAIRVDRFWTYRCSAPDFWGVDGEGPGEGASSRLMDLAAVGAVVLHGDREELRGTNLMLRIEDKGLRTFEGAHPPEFRVVSGEPRRAALLSDAPFKAKTRWAQLGAFEQLAFQYGVEGRAVEPVRFEVVLATKEGETSLFDATLSPDDDGWRTARVELPEGLRRASLELRVTAPEGTARDVGFADLRLLRIGRLDDEHLEPRFESPPFTVLENTNALPRAYVAHRAVVAPPGRVIDALEAPDFVPGRDVVLESESPLELPADAAGPSRARIAASGARRVVVEVETEDDGILVLCDTFYPGWTARVDGEEREILPANLMFRGVPVEAGRHTVEFTYDPASFRWGAGLSLATALSLLVTWFRRRDPSPGERLPRAASRALVALAAAAGTVAVLEVVARVVHRPADPAVADAPWNPEDESFTPPPNRFGHREGELDSLPDGAARLLFLGDSFTYGHGLADGSARFTERVELELGDRVHVYNAGVNGANPSQWLETLEVLFPEYEPDVVFGVFFLRCGTSLATSFRFYERFLRGIRRPYERSRLHDVSALYRVWAERRVRREFTDYYADRMIAAYLGSESETERWREEQAALLEIDAYCKARGVKFHLVVFPMLFRLADYPFAQVEEEIQRFARAEGLELHSLTPAFLGRSASELWVHANDQHPNAEGHRIAADALSPYLESVLPD